MDKSIYLNEVLSQANRLIGLLDRNPASKMYGCFDRQYWHYKTTDFPCCRAQEAALTLSLLYKIKHKSNQFYNNPLLLEWINATIDFWAKIQNSDGSFNEWYPNEHSYGPTAFGTYAISESLIIMEKEIKNYKHIIKKLKKSADWLVKHKELRVQNQECGAIAALYNVFLLTSEKRYKFSAKKKLDQIKNLQTKEGWLIEYGGADIGYLSLAIDYIAKYYKKSKNKKALAIASKATEFMSYFIHPNFTYGGEYGSRNTAYLIPSGFEILAGIDKNSATISNHIKKSLYMKTAVNPSSLDDRYLTYITYNWLQAYIESRNISYYKSKFNKNFNKKFPLAGIFIHSNNEIYSIVNCKKGGALEIFLKKINKNINDSGILVFTKNIKLTSSKLTNNNKISTAKNRIRIRGNLYQIRDNQMTPSRNVLFRLFQMSVGRSDKIGLYIKEKFRNKLITSAVKDKSKFTREITFDKYINIKDSIITNKKIEKIFLGTKLSLIYVPSSRYFSISELDNKCITLKGNNKKVEITRTYDKNSGKLLDLQFKSQHSIRTE